MKSSSYRLIFNPTIRNAFLSSQGIEFLPRYSPNCCKNSVIGLLFVFLKYLTENYKWNSSFRCRMTVILVFLCFPWICHLCLSLYNSHFSIGCLSFPVLLWQLFSCVLLPLWFTLLCWVWGSIYIHYVVLSPCSQFTHFYILLELEFCALNFRCKLLQL